MFTAFSSSYCAWDCISRMFRVVVEPLVLIAILRWFHKLIPTDWITYTQIIAIYFFKLAVDLCVWRNAYSMIIVLITINNNEAVFALFLVANMFNLLVVYFRLYYSRIYLTCSHQFLNLHHGAMMKMKWRTVKFCLQTTPASKRSG